MTRYREIPWPWVGLLLALALVGQEHLFKWLGANPTLAQTSYRILVMTIGITSVTLLLLTSRRPAYLLGFLVCAGLMGWALWLQYGLGLDPCPLCVIQRIAVIAIGVVFLLAGLHNPGRMGAAVYAGLTLVIGVAGIVTAGRHVWLQSLPKDQVPACGMGLNYMLDTLPFTEVLSKVFAGSGECAEAGWLFLGLGIPAWTLVFFVAMIVAALALIKRD
jgi:disulfide bond formation protein DsbB